MSCPSGEELLGPFMNLLRSREALYPQMCQLKGKLELIKGNIQAKEFKAEQPNEALLVYHDGKKFCLTNSTQCISGEILYVNVVKCCI